MSSRTIDKNELYSIAVTAASHIVKYWESIPNRASKLASEIHRAGDLLELQRAIERTLRNMVGGEELYRASKKFLEDEEKPLGR